MDMSRFCGEQFIKVADVRDGPLLVRISVIKEGKYSRPDLIFETGEILSLNATNNRTLVRAYGASSDDWIGKEIELCVGQVEFKGEMQDSVIVRPVSPPIPADERTAAAKTVTNSDLDDEIQM
jgi:hypothetical protein